MKGVRSRLRMHIRRCSLAANGETVDAKHCAAPSLRPRSKQANNASARRVKIPYRAPRWPCDVFWKKEGGWGPAAAVVGRGQGPSGVEAER